MERKFKIRKITLIGVFCALAYVSVFARFPIVLFLKYEPKDIIITLGGLIMGPLASVIISVVSSFIEMLTVSDTGPIGFLMNVISSCAFACPAAMIYKKYRTLKGAVVGLVCGLVTMVAAMMLWNYCITPIYMNTPRAAVAAMLPTVFLPFNLLKGGINAALTYLLYRPAVDSLRAAKLIPPSAESPKKRFNIPLFAASVAVLVTCVLVILSYKGII